MSISQVAYRPKRWSSGYNPIVWSVNSTQTTQPDFKYVFDVTVNGATGDPGYTYRIKQRPNPSGYGMIDVSTLVQPFINLSLYNPEINSSQYYRNGDLLPFVHVKAGEEYVSSGALTIFNGKGATGSPDFLLDPFETTGQPVRVIPSALDYYTQMEIMQFTTPEITDPGSKATLTISFNKLSDWQFPQVNVLTADMPGPIALSASFPITVTPYTFTDNFYDAEIKPVLLASNWNTYFDIDDTGITAEQIVLVLRAKIVGTSRNLTNITAGAPAPDDVINIDSYVDGTNSIININPFWRDYIMDGNGKFLTREPGTRQVRLTDRHTLTFLNQWDDADPQRSSSILGIWVKTYNSAGTLISTTPYYNTADNGGGPQINTSYTSITENRISDFLSFKCGPVDLNITNPNVAYYTVQAFRKVTSAITPDYPASELITFNIQDECQDLYQNVRLSWLNDLGGRDYYNFNMFYEKTTSATFSTYNQNELNWGGISPVTTTGQDVPIFNRGGDKIYNKTITTKFEIQSDWLTQDYVDYLSGVADSPSVWAYIGDDYNIPHTVVIDNTTYTYKTVKQTKLVQATFECRLTKTQNRQQG